MIKEAIILAGGLGTRLRGVIRGIPKPMAPIGEKPFLAFLLDYLNFNGIKKIIISVGYKKEAIINYFGNSYKNSEIIYSEEHTPLGTGGAILKAFKLVEGDESFVLNGDTLFKIKLKDLYEFHKQKKADISIALKDNDFKRKRYGNVLLSKEGRIIGFEEKRGGSAFINGGIYLLKGEVFENSNFSERFSFEKDFLEKKISEFRIFGKVFNDYFIDIGIPKDYERAKREIKKITRK